MPQFIPRDMLISTLELSSIIDDPDVLIVDVRSFAEYSKEHIPNAVNLDLFAFHWIDTTRKGIQNFNDQTASLFSAIGAQGKRVILYDNISGMLAARGVWMLLYMSKSDVAVLDGGIAKWSSDSLPIQSGTNRFRPSKFAGRPDSKLVIGFEEIRDRLGRIKIIDARTSAEYDGTIARAAMSGHIPTSINLDWNLNLTKDGLFADAEVLSKLYGMPSDSQIVTYCHGGYRAAHTFLALKLLGFNDVRVYLGSWGEWGNNTSLPAEC